MNISKTSLNFSANKAAELRKLKPLTEYKGPILKLTPEDIQKINRLQAEVDRLEHEVYRMSITPIFNLNGYVQARIDVAADSLIRDIDRLRDKIRQIKVDRYNIQKASMG